MLGYLDFLFLSYSGRIGRGAFWLGTLALAVLHWGAQQWLIGDRLTRLRLDGAPLSQDAVVHVIVPALLLVLLFSYPNYALCTKRWHDRGKSGWWNFIILDSGDRRDLDAGRAGFLGGEDGVNEYGAR